MDLVRLYLTEKGQTTLPYQILTINQAASAVGDQRFHLIKGEEVLKDFTYLSTDLLHPSDNGHIRMGANLAVRLIEERKRSFGV
ncbi:hypothetical protein [Clostridium boliviensis]|nr:hypothetical protein [Clostridium boliviensis]